MNRIPKILIAAAITVSAISTASAQSATTVFAKSRESTANPSRFDSHFDGTQKNNRLGRANSNDRRLDEHRFCQRAREGCGMYGCRYLWQSAAVC